MTTPAPTKASTPARATTCHICGAPLVSTAALEQHHAKVHHDPHAGQGAAPRRPVEQPHPPTSYPELIDLSHLHYEEQTAAKPLPWWRRLRAARRSSGS